MPCLFSAWTVSLPGAHQYTASEFRAGWAPALGTGVSRTYIGALAVWRNDCLQIPQVMEQAAAFWSGGVSWRLSLREKHAGRRLNVRPLAATWPSSYPSGCARASARPLRPGKPSAIAGLIPSLGERLRCPFCRGGGVDGEAIESVRQGGCWSRRLRGGAVVRLGLGASDRRARGRFAAHEFWREGAATKLCTFFFFSVSAATPAVALAALGNVRILE